MYALIENDVVIKYPYTLGDLKKSNPNTSFADSVNNEVLAEFGMQIVYNTTPPPYTQLQYLEELTPQFNVENQRWEQVWLVVDKTPEQIAQEQEALAQQNKAIGKQILADTDWTAISSIADPLQSNPYLINREEFLNYRNTIRNIVLNPTWDAVFPPEPLEIWSN